MKATLQERLAASNIYEVEIRTATAIFREWLRDINDNTKDVSHKLLLEKLIEDCTK